MLQKHVQDLLCKASRIYRAAANTVEKSKSDFNSLFGNECLIVYFENYSYFKNNFLIFTPSGVLYDSCAGAMLSKLLHSLLLIPANLVQPLMFKLLELLLAMDDLTRLLPISHHTDLDVASSGKAADFT